MERILQQYIWPYNDRRVEIGIAQEVKEGRVMDEYVYHKVIYRYKTGKDVEKKIHTEDMAQELNSLKSLLDKEYDKYLKDLEHQSR